MWSTLKAAYAGNYLLLACLASLFGSCFPGAEMRIWAQTEVQRPRPIADTGSAHEIAPKLLHLALHKAVWGPPANCIFRQQIELYGHTVRGFGKFVRAGEGSGKLRLSIQFPAADAMNSLMQVSDGQRLHTIEDIGGVGKRTIVDLGKVRKRLIINDQSINDPSAAMYLAMYLAIGGQAESLRKLCQQYEWTDVKSGDLGASEVWVLSGQLAKEPPAIRALAATDMNLHTPNASGLLPTQVRVVIGKDSSSSQFPYWLYQVEQQRSESEVSPANLRARVYLLTEWVDPALVTQPIPPEVFEPSSTNDPIFEETDKYLPPPLNVAQNPLSIESLAPEISLR